MPSTESGFIEGNKTGEWFFLEIVFNSLLRLPLILILIKRDGFKNNYFYCLKIRSCVEIILQSCERISSKFLSCFLVKFLAKIQIYSLQYAYVFYSFKIEFHSIAKFIDKQLFMLLIWIYLELIWFWLKKILLKTFTKKILIFIKKKQVAAKKTYVKPN